MDVADRLELGALITGYAAAVDTRRWDEVAGLFIADGELVSPDPPRSLLPVTAVRGHAAIVAALQGLEHFACTFHHVTGSVLTQTGEQSAHGRTTGEAHHVEGTRSLVWHLIYDDAFVRGDEGWRFTRRALTIRMIESRAMVGVLPT